MQTFVAVSLSLSLVIMAPSAHAKVLKKFIVVGAVLAAGKAIAQKHQEQKLQQTQEMPQKKDVPQPVYRQQSMPAGAWSTRSPYDQE